MKVLAKLRDRIPRWVWISCGVVILLIAALLWDVPGRMQGYWQDAKRLESGNYRLVLLEEVALSPDDVIEDVTWVQVGEVEVPVPFKGEIKVRDGITLVSRPGLSITLLPGHIEGTSDETITRLRASRPSFLQYLTLSKAGLIEKRKDVALQDVYGLVGPDGVLIYLSDERRMVVHFGGGWTRCAGDIQCGREGRFVQFSVRTKGDEDQREFFRKILTMRDRARIKP